MPVSCRQPAQQKQDGWDEISCHGSYSVWASIARGSRLFWKYSLPAKNDKMLLMIFFFIVRFEFCNAGYSQPGAELEMTKHFHNRPLGLQPVVWGKCHCPMWSIRPKDTTARLAVTLMPAFPNSVVWPQGYREKYLNGGMMMCWLYGVCTSGCRPHGVERHSICSGVFISCVVQLPLPSEATRYLGWYLDHLNLE